jgi:hypothetical protein
MIGGMAEPVEQQRAEHGCKGGGQGEFGNDLEISLPAEQGVFQEIIG